MKVNLIQLPAINGRLQQPIPVAAGQVIRVQVIKAEGSQVWLQLGGHVVKADARIALSQGEHLQLQVASVQPDLIQMKVLPETFPSKTIDSVFTQLGLPGNPIVKDIVAQMVRFGLPLSSTAILEMFNFVKGYQFKDDIIQMLVWLKSIGIKTTGERDVEALAALKKFLRGDLTENEEIRFFKFLNQTSNEALGAYNIFGWPLENGHIYLIARDSKQEQPRMDNSQVLIRLDSAALQELWFKLYMSGQTLNLEISCSSPTAQEIIVRETKHLETALQTAGYQTGKTTVQLLKIPQTILDFIPGSGSQSLSLDIKV